MYKDNCGFRTKSKVCSFKAYDCNPEKCDFYNLEFNSKAIKKELDEVIKKVKEKRKRVKELHKKDDKQTKNEIKKLVKEMIDLSFGVKYLKDSLRYCKRAGL